MQERAIWLGTSTAISAGYTAVLRRVPRCQTVYVASLWMIIEAVEPCAVEPILASAGTDTGHANPGDGTSRQKFGSSSKSNMRIHCCCQVHTRAPVDQAVRHVICNNF